MKLKVRSTPRFLSSIFGGTGTAVRKDGLATYVDLDYGSLEPLSTFDPSTKQFAVVDSLSGEWNKTTLSDVLAVSGYVASSLSPATIGLGSVVFTTQEGLAYQAGARVRASSRANTANYMEGLVTSYSGATLTVAVSYVAGTGSHSDWNLSLAGDPGTGDMLSTNNGLDFANTATALNNLNGVSYGAVQSLTSAQQLQARQNINAARVGVLNILDYGGVADGATNNDAAIAAAWAALPAKGGCIYFPSGEYVFSSPFAKTMPDSHFAVWIRGDGVATELRWPNASGGIQITGTTSGGVSHNVVHITDLMITTSQAGGGNAIKLIEGGSVNTPGSVIRDVVIQGDDYNQGSGSNYWTVDIHIHAWEAIVLDRVQANGKWIDPLTSALGTGIIIEGDAATSRYTQSIKMINCNIGYHSYGIVLGSYWQGVLISQCNFGANQGIFVPAAQTGTLVQINVSNSIFYVAHDAIEFNTNVIQAQISYNNIIQTEATGAGGLIFNGSSQPIAMGNCIVKFGTQTGTGIVSNADNGVFIGNIIVGFTTGVFLGASSTGAVCVLNRYPSTATKTADASGANSIGTAAAGNMTGVIP